MAGAAPGGRLLDDIVGHLQHGDIAAIGRTTTANFTGPIQTIIPWASNLYTESLIQKVRADFGAGFWGFWMLGGMSGGGMGFIFDPRRKDAAQERLPELMAATKERLQHSLPFAMDPVVYDFSINERGTYGDLLSGAEALLPSGYYALIVPTSCGRGSTACRPRGSTSWTSSARPAAHGRSWPAWCRPCSTPSCPGETRRARAAPSWTSCWPGTALIAPNTSRSA